MKWTRLFPLALFAAVALAQPVRFEPAAVDFGTKGQGLRLEAEVKMTNTTAGAIQVLNVSSDCSCAAGEPRQRQLAPGASTMIPVSMDTRTYLGPVQRRLVVHTSAGDAELKVTANIRAFANWELMPTPLMLESTLRTEEASAVLTATYLGTEQVAVQSAMTNQPWLRASVTAATSGQGASILLQKLPGAPAGYHTVDLTLKTSDPTQPQLTVKVLVPVRSVARVEPSPIVLPTTSVGTATSREISVRGWDDERPPRASLPRGRVEARGRQPNGDYVFNVSVTPTAPGMSTQVLQFSVDDASVAIEVPVLLKAEPK